uniref:Transthyretin-like family protein n=1 Tax=Acrobeloides nanus TaxID=290746 RepID=A0A914DCZ9_9BILA
MYDDDRGVDLDDFMGESKTRGDGTFEVQGSSHEFTSIDPKINIYHDCDDELTPCQRKISIMIPDSYVNSNNHYDAGTIELAGKFRGEERDCIN